MVVVVTSHKITDHQHVHNMCCLIADGTILSQFEEKQLKQPTVAFVFLVGSYSRLDGPTRTFKINNLCQRNDSIFALVKNYRQNKYHMAYLNLKRRYLYCRCKQRVYFTYTFNVLHYPNIPSFCRLLYSSLPGTTWYNFDETPPNWPQKKVAFSGWINEQTQSKDNFFQAD